MKIHFQTGSEEDSGFNFFANGNRNATDRVLGPSGLLAFFELHCGLTAKTYSEPGRMIAFRNRLTEIIKEQHPFYRSFSSNEFAVCLDLLHLYDELILLEWKGDFNEHTPRLQILTEARDVLENCPGESDRWVRLSVHLAANPFPEGVVDEILVYDAEEWIHPFFRKFFQIPGLPSVKYAGPAAGEETLNNLGTVKQKFLHQDFSSFSFNPASKDSSLLIVNSDQVSFLADIVNIVDRKDCILVDGGQAGLIDASASRTGMPLSGLYPGSLNNGFNMLPFQLVNILKETPDALTLISFLQNFSCPVSKALREPLRKLIRHKPGFDPVFWKKELLDNSGDEENQFLIDHENNHSTYKEIEDEIAFWFSGARTSEIRDNQYWFEKKAINTLFLKAAGRLRERNSPEDAADFLEQILAVMDNFMVDEISEQQLYLFLSAFIKPVGSVTALAETGFIPCALSASSVISRFGTVIWWNMSEDATGRDISLFYSVEKDFLLGKTLWTPQFEKSLTERWYFQSARPILNCGEQLILLTSHTINGQEAERHPFLDFLESSAENPEAVIFDPGKNQEALFEILETIIPDLTTETAVARNLPKPQDFWKITSGLASLSKTESFSSLESLIYYPHEYVLERIAGIKDYRLHDPDETLLNFGNCSHRIFELLFNTKEVLKASDNELERMIVDLSSQVIREQFIALNSPEFRLQKQLFALKMQRAAKVLFHHLRTGNFTEAVAEENFKKDRAVTFGNIQLTGKIDLHLNTADGRKAIIDLKWSGASKRKGLLQEEKDIQLCLYSYLLSNTPDVPAAYFIIDSAQLISYKHDLFPEAHVIFSQNSSERIFGEMAGKIRKAYDLRKAEIESGLVEVGLETEYTTLADNSGVWKKQPEGVGFPPAWTKESGMKYRKPVNKYSNYTLFSPVK